MSAFGSKADIAPASQSVRPKADISEPFQYPDLSSYDALPRSETGMKRREFITLLGGAVAWPVAARAQQGEPTRRIGVLMPFRARIPRYEPEASFSSRVSGQLGWTVGQDLQIDYRSAGGERHRSADTRRN